MPNIVKTLSDVSIVGIGDRSRLEEFSWSRLANVRLADCRAGRYSIAEQFELPRAIPAGTDLFFSPYYTIPLFYRGKLAVTVHDLSHRVVPEIINNPKKRIYAQIMFRAVRKRASVIFTDSLFSKQELLRFTSGLREDNILPVHLGISPDWYRAPQYPKIRTRPYFIHVGNIKPYKNLRRMVDAFLQIRDKIPHDLVIVGQSEGLITGEAPGFFETVKSASDRIHLTGFVSYEDLLSLMGHADALVMPSLYEGFGLPPVDAMAAGVPVVVSKAASLPEVCGDAALYFDPLKTEDIADKLVLIATNEALRRQLAEKGLDRSKMFLWESCADRIAAALRLVLESSGPVKEFEGALP